MAQRRRISDRNGAEGDCPNDSLRRDVAVNYLIPADRPIRDVPCYSPRSAAWSECRRRCGGVSLAATTEAVTTTTTTTATKLLPVPALFGVAADNWRFSLLRSSGSIFDDALRECECIAMSAGCRQSDRFFSDARPTLQSLQQQQQQQRRRRQLYSTRVS